MLTTVGERCGISAYSRALCAELQELCDLTMEPITVGQQPLEYYQEQATRLNRADVVHIQHEHSFWGGILPGKSAFWNLRYMLKVPFVITAHTTTDLPNLLRLPDERRPLHKIAKSLLVRRKAYRDSVDIAPFITSRCIVHTQEAREQLIGRGAQPPFVHVIPAGVPHVKFASDNGEAFRKRFGLGDDRLIVEFGFIAPNKGYEIMFDALAKLPENVRFVIAGGARTDEAAPYLELIKKKAITSKVEERVTITDFLDDDLVAGAMAAADVVVAPHTQATGSYSITIPLAYGKAIVTSDLACFREIELEGNALATVPTGDSARLAGKLSWLLNNPDEKKNLESHALKFANDHSWKQAAHKTIDVYGEAIADEVRLAHHLMPGKHA